MELFDCVGYARAHGVTELVGLGGSVVTYERGPGSQIDPVGLVKSGNPGIIPSKDQPQVVLDLVVRKSASGVRG